MDLLFGMFEADWKQALMYSKFILDQSVDVVDVKNRTLMSSFGARSICDSISQMNYRLILKCI